MVYFVVARPNVYDGLRHFLFILPVLAILAAAGAQQCSTWVTQLLTARGNSTLGIRSEFLTLSRSHGFTLLLLMSALPSLFTMHPYQYAYYNLLAGDRATLHERFETDYWLTSYRDAAIWLNHHPTNHPLRVFVTANGRSFPCIGRFIREDIRLDAAFGDFSRNAFPPGYDYSVASARYGFWKNFPNAAIVHRIERDGVLMCVIRHAP
jgi:hypothetical protein